MAVNQTAYEAEQGRRTSAVTSVSQKGNTINSFSHRTEIAEYVYDRLRSLKPGSQLIMTINHWKSGAFSVQTATGTLSGGSETPKSSTGLDVT